MFRFKFIVLLIAISGNLLFSQNNFSSTDSLENTNQNFFNNINSDIVSAYNVGKSFFLSPLQFDSHDYILAGIIIGTTAFSFTLDNPVRNSVENFHSKPLDNIMFVGDQFGNGRYGMALGGLLYFSGHILKEKELRTTGLMLAEAILLNGFITQSLKMIIGRSRPYKEEGHNEIDFPAFELNNDNQSLPSGHASTAFAIATVLSNRVDNPYFSTFIYSLAALTAYQRLYNDRHWISDTVLGAALGTVIGLKVVNLNESSDTSGEPEITFIPLINNQTYGIIAAFHF
jgi:membrane-associated phospholipid phosphatase